MEELNISAFSEGDLSLLKKLKSPYRIQVFVSSLEYTFGGRIAPITVLRTRRGDCLEAAIFACMALRFHNIESFLMDLRAVRDEDHILCVFKMNNRYGAIAKSKFCWLRYRNPVYATIRELVLSYFEHYFNYFGEWTLREYSAPLYPWKGSPGWVADSRATEKIEKRINEIRHHDVIPFDKVKERIDPQSFWREVLIIPGWAKIRKEYRDYQKKKQQ
jgi:hypothetical protein